MTRCKPGDTAYIVRPFDFTPAVGRVVTVQGEAPVGHKTRCPDGGFIEFVPDRYALGWLCIGAIPTPWGDVPEFVIADECLLPFRDPGDDAKDESARWLPPVPTTTKEHAT